MSAPRDDFLATDRRGLRIEIGVMLAVTFGVSAVTAILQLLDGVLSGLAGRRVRLNPNLSRYDLINLGLNLASVAQLVAWGALGLYLLWRSGISPARVGLGRLRWRSDVLGGLGLAALIGIPGLLLYLAARWLGMNAQVEPSALHDSWWRIPVLIFSAFANGFAEEVVVVGYLITRLKQLGFSQNRAVLVSSVLRGMYHLYQGFGAGLGNLVMGLVFGYVWCRTGRLWPLVIAHGVIDTVAFVGYVALAGHVGWLT
ncbi:CPBP family intramembrane glutamic endopeptidase [Mycolicibacterium aichiense]|uniref:Abortive infection protein n=1 Tax=Mycolicibacterium aichiense TaxID=1799 RepID=A0AAD1HH66_9MYCO|nr:CPBP family intramembrane glutamic endopeptidase [Mycolicibacterium aichiense]MCV7020815.1 CPBP family intramembrane metalloprotease [Mycolicibacterium aichiense]BBX05382.1 abortive infection protein [Mycolicibacterium aichiense]STZ25266.1 CAAX amino terminal protease family [Mycolicibacterium aichiense]